MDSLYQLDSFKKNGIIKIKNFLSQSEVDKIIKSLRPFIGLKNEKTTYFSTNFKKYFYKLLKFHFYNFITSDYLIRISQKKKNESVC